MKPLASRCTRHSPVAEHRLYYAGQMGRLRLEEVQPVTQEQPVWKRYEPSLCVCLLPSFLPGWWQTRKVAIRRRQVHRSGKCVLWLFGTFLASCRKHLPPSGTLSRQGPRLLFPLRREGAVSRRAAIQQTVELCCVTLPT